MSENADIYDSGDFIELLIKHLFRSKEVLARAKQLGLKGDDLITSVDFGIRLYKTFADIALDIGVGPIEMPLLGVYLRSKIESQEIHPNIIDQASQLYAWIYESNELNTEYYVNCLLPFIKHRRQERVKTENSDNTDKLRTELNRIDRDLSKEDTYAQVKVINPFKTLIKKDIVDLVKTGLLRLDVALGGGSGRAEFGIIIGFSGGGKTALASNIAVKSAMSGNKVAYMSIEESAEDLSNRCYSQIFRVNYSSLHNGSGYMELEEKFGSIDPVIEERRKMLETNLRLFGLKGLSPLKPVQLFELLVKQYELDGFMPDLVIVDQLQFLEPDEKLDAEPQWQKEQRVAEDLDKMSHQKIGDKYFTLWALHQAKGKLKKNFTNEDISGFKGITHKPDTVLGIGRANPTANDFEVFSIKSRHSKNFQLDYIGDLEYMTFEDPPQGAPKAGQHLPTHGTAQVALSPAQQIALQCPIKEEAQLGDVKVLLSPGVPTSK